MGNKETLQGRACIQLSRWYTSGREFHCAVTTLTASEKQFKPVNMTVQYPRGGAVERPAIAFQHELRRVAFDQPGQWESLKVGTDPVLLQVWVKNRPAEIVQLVLAPSKTLQTVDLKNGDGFAAFQTAFSQAEETEADVQLAFRFYTSAAPNAAHYPEKSVTLFGKSDEERLVELQDIATRAARKLVTDRYTGGRNVSASILGWKFDRPNKRYVADVRMNWNGLFFATNSYWVEGRLIAGEAGDSGSFELTAEGPEIVGVKNTMGITIATGAVLHDLLSK